MSRARGHQHRRHRQHSEPPDLEFISSGRCGNCRQRLDAVPGPSMSVDVGDVILVACSTCTPALLGLLAEHGVGGEMAGTLVDLIAEMNAEHGQ